jgi:tetratricopeptide (TPR) repeat protein
MSRQYVKAIEAFTQTLDVHPEWVWGYVKRGIARAYDGQSDKALEDAKRAEALIGASGETPLLRSWLGVLYARAGDHAAARSCIKRLEEIARQKVVGASDFAVVYAVLGENEKAFAWLEEGIRLRDPGMSFVPASHFHDGLRDDPRFASVVKRIGLGETKPPRL